MVLEMIVRYTLYSIQGGNSHYIYVHSTSLLQATLYTFISILELCCSLNQIKTKNLTFDILKGG